MIVETNSTHRDRTGVADVLRATPTNFVVNPERRIIYMKPAKTGGTSVFRALLEPRLGGFLVPKSDGPLHEKWLEGISDDALVEYYFFATVRDPIDRFVSLCNHFGLSVSSVLERFDTLCAESPKFELHARPLIDYTHIGDRQFVDRICKTESLSDDVPLLLEDLGLDAWDVPHENRSRRKLSNLRISKHQVAQIAALYPNDFKHYGYEMPHE